MSPPWSNSKIQRGQHDTERKLPSVATCRLSRRLAILKLKMTHFEKKNSNHFSKWHFHRDMNCDASNYVIINRTQIELEIATQNVSFRRKVIVCNNAKHGHVLKLHFATTHTMVSILCTKSGFIPYLILIRKRGHTQVSLFQKLTPHLALFQCMAWVIDRRLKYLKMRPRWSSSIGHRLS